MTQTFWFSFATTTQASNLTTSSFALNQRRTHKTVSHMEHQCCEATAWAGHMPAHPLSVCSPWVRYNISPPWDWKGTFPQSIKCTSRASTDHTTNVRSSQLSQCTCVPASPRMEGICWDCSTLRRTCKKHDIECTPACGNCRGSGCTNSLQMSCDDDGDDGVA